MNISRLTLSFWQLILMAFPMVLAGTFLTGLVGLYVLPYDWSFNFAMTFGSILTATDPVAVSALMHEVGAPPRLQIHVGGESMFNDGSAVVFYTIFSGMYLLDMGQELDISGIGTAVDVAKGFAIFFQMSLGGAAIGIAFGLGLLFLLLILNHRLEMEENVIQVAATVGIAYTTFFVAEIVAKCSGVIAVVFCGITVRAFGSSIINDPGLMQSFWTLLEHLLNSVLFALGGVVWGAIIANDSPAFTAKDWGSLFILYAMLNVIRFFLVFSFYPVLSRIGLGSNLQEAVFLSFGGLRGAVGIALAISLTEKVEKATGGGENKFTEDVTKLFGMVGGISFLTLFVNGTLCGPLIKKLGLTKSTETRKKVVEHHLKKAREHILDDFVHLMTLPYFYPADFAVTKNHVKLFEGLTFEELDYAVGQNKALVPPSQYKAPYLKYVVPYLTREPDEKSGDRTQKSRGAEDSGDEATEGRKELLSSFDDTLQHEKMKSKETAASDVTTDVRTIELRLLLIDILQMAYKKLDQKGELDARRYSDYRLYQSLEFASVEARNGKPLNDWENISVVGEIWANSADIAIDKIHRLKKCKRYSYGEINNQTGVKTALAFIAAHQQCQIIFIDGFTKVKEEFTAAEDIVLQESEAEVTKAKEYLASFEACEVSVIVSFLLSTILLNKTARYLEYLCTEGLLHPGEISDQLEGIEEELRELRHCHHTDIPGALTTEEMNKAMDDAGFKERIKYCTGLRESLHLVHGLEYDMNVLEEEFSA